MPSDEQESSGVQRKWEVTVSELHAQLRAMIPLIPAMKPEEVKSLVDSLDNAMWLELRASTIDKRIDLELAKVVPD